jgi:hypothetical protein
MTGDLSPEVKQPAIQFDALTEAATLAAQILIVQPGRRQLLEQRIELRHLDLLFVMVYVVLGSYTIYEAL